MSSHCSAADAVAVHFCRRVSRRTVRARSGQRLRAALLRLYGSGAPWVKRDTYWREVILRLWPVPLYIQYR